MMKSRAQQEVYIISSGGTRIANNCKSPWAVCVHHDSQQLQYTALSMGEHPHRVPRLTQSSTL